MTTGASTSGRLLTAKEAAVRLGVEPETVRRWARQDKIGHVHVGPFRHLRFRECDIEAMIHAHGEATDAL